MKKFFLSSLFAILALCASAYDFEVNGIYYNITSTRNKTVEVTHNGRATYRGNVYIPTTVTYNYVNFNVTTIGESAFANSSNLAQVSIPYGITQIGKRAFYGCSFTTLTLPASLTSIGEEAFKSCSKLETLNIPANVTNIGNGVFSYCYALTSLDIPDNVTNIGNKTFEYCHNLRTVGIPDKVTNIGDSAFYNC